MTTSSGGFAAVNPARQETVRLAMESLWLTGRVLPVGARLVVVHAFRSAEPDPVEVVYAFGLPRDAALRRFKVVAEGFQVRSELRPVAEAQEIYERGIQRGDLATLARAYRDGRVNLSVGNIRPGELVKVFLELVAGVDLRDESLRFRFPFTLAPCYHAQARGVEAEPGTLEMTLPEVEFGDLLLPQWMEDGTSLHRVGFDLAVAWPGKLDEVGSPSHRIRVTGTGDGEARVTPGAASDVPDRDLVLDVRGTPSSVRAYGGTVAGQHHHISVVVPSTWFGATAAAPRHVIFLLDRSGSMGGGAPGAGQASPDSLPGGAGPGGSVQSSGLRRLDGIVPPRIRSRDPRVSGPGPDKQRRLCGASLLGAGARHGPILLGEVRPDEIDRAPQRPGRSDESGRSPGRGWRPSRVR